ncbi:glycoside hydrolase family 32 protein [Aaosphaeria arxii CBS 175.79]|uniref:Glycoside hydrolase family 32 protein n=1 Tax=Aaosphaeria arxii CBS 175.79 TaxID=1450172 RepID=A0A6A5XGG2_9PLEO|nr:glycoside hydrolase family 32 protein [Aaosphaeria arxii CBS 175.79]KAF2011946.1 glycoside hydrolase family 32 protein [Aaosphaeria arxii CBS 175.79]
MFFSRSSLLTALPALLCSSALAQNATTTYSQSNVPTGTPLPGNYGGPLRPQVHFSPPQGFMNDPNGMFVDADGLYHLYYQYNPTANRAGNQHWGHATSEDLFTWTNQQIALFPGGPEEGIFSGSIVIDGNNTSGFFPNQTNGVVAIYTLNTPESQTQDIAYSFDGGYTFTKYENNPVIDRNTNQFRDPKVFWYEETSRWVMVVAYPVDFEVGIFTSENLIDWQPESNFSHYGVTGLLYECPNLVPLPIENSTLTNDTQAWALLVSINPGAPLGGSITQYFLGSFNGTHFDPLDSRTRFTDFAKDNYAGQFFDNIPFGTRQVSMSWASNWQYTNVVPTDREGFRSAMSVAREHWIQDRPRVGLSLMSYPANISAAFDSELASNSSLGNGTLNVDFGQLESRALYWEANITGLGDSTSLQGTLNFTFSSSSTGEYVSGGTFISSGDVWVDRGHSSAWSNPFFTDKFSTSGLYDGAGTWRLSGIVDRSILEVYLNGGEEVATSVFFPTEPLDTAVFRVGGINESASASVAVWGLKAAWLDQANANGTVVGNVTQSGNGTEGLVKLF